MTEAGEPTGGRLALQLGGRLFVLEPGRIYRIGRDPESDLRVNHASVADHHAGVSTAAGRAVVEDLTGAGIAINGRRVRRAELTAGDRLQVGAITVGVVPASGPPPVALPARAPQSGLARGTGALAARYREQDSFAHLMAEELQRTPWLLLSLVIHAALLLLLWLWLRPPAPSGLGAVQLSIAEGEQLGDIEDTSDQPEVVEEELADAPIEEPDYAAAEFEAAPPETMPLERHDLLGSDVDLFAKIGSSHSDDIMSADRGKLRAGGFGKAVSRLRRSGLDVVFVFDSTGSMANALAAAKERISEMVRALHALVPKSRVGVITFRDTGKEEDYVTRSVPLSYDFYRAINFVQVIGAGGGGDPPEAVYEALQGAFRQAWSPTSRRVVLLIGDAPPHRRAQQSLRSEAGQFASDGRSSIHTIVTSPDGDPRALDDTLRAFETIAKSGHGECVRLEHDLGEVICLAFGSEYRAQIGEVFQILQERQARISTATRDLVRRRRPAELVRALSRTPIDDELVRALVASDDRELLRTLTRLAGRPELPPAAHHALAYVLQRALGLRRPPIDPIAGGPMTAATQSALLRLLEP